MRLAAIALACLLVAPLGAVQAPSTLGPGPGNDVGCRVTPRSIYWKEPRSIAPYDQSAGPLTHIQIDLCVPAVYDFTFENEAFVPGIAAFMGTIDVRASFTEDMSQVFIETHQVFMAFSPPLAAFDGALDFAGPSSWTISLEDAQLAVVQANVADTGAFSTPTPIWIEAVATVQAGGIAPHTFMADPFAAAGLGVHYNP